MSPHTPPIRVTFDEERICEIVREDARPFVEELAVVTAERDKALAGADRWMQQARTAIAERNNLAARIDKALAIPNWGFDPDDEQSIRDAQLINATLGLVRRALTKDAQ